MTSLGKYNLQLWVAISLLLLFSSCRYDKYLPEGESLLWQNRIILKNKLEKWHKDEVNSELYAAIAQSNNHVLFGLDLETANLGYKMPRVRLATYNLLHNRIVKKRDSLFISKNIMERPVAYDSMKKNVTLKHMKSVLNNHGYFYASVSDSIFISPRNKTSVYYIINPGKSYTIDSVYVHAADDSIKHIAIQAMNKGLLKPGNNLSQVSIASETSRLSEILNNSGYFNARPQAIRITIDTVDNPEYIRQYELNKKDPILSTIPKNISNKASIHFYINDSVNGSLITRSQFGKANFYLTDKYTAEQAQENNALKHYESKDYNIHYITFMIKPEVLQSCNYIMYGKQYNTADIDNTMKRLNTLTIFNSISLDIQEIKDSNQNSSIICNFYLTPADRYDFEARVEGSNSDRYDFGSGIKLSLKDKNIMHSGSSINLGISGGFQSAIDNIGPKIIPTQNTLGINGQLTLAKPIIPNDWFSKEERRNITSSLKAGYNINNILSFLSQTDAEINFSYDWFKNKQTNLKFTPVSFTYLQIDMISQQAIDSVTKNPFLNATLKDFIILGSSLNFDYTNKRSDDQHRYYFYRTGIEKSGSLLYAIFRNQNISQYIRLDNEFKYYFNYRHSMWVNRMFTSFAFPKKGTSIPFLKLNSAGGSNGMRGWQANELGPGRTRSIDVSDISRVSNRGDIKIELNSEYRFELFKLFGGFMKVGGTTFTDVGNIWRYRDASNNFAGQFKFNKLAQDIAADVGLGTRIDFSLFLIRFERAMQIKKPYLLNGNYGWVWDEMDLSSKAWRKESMRWQWGINVPF